MAALGSSRKSVAYTFSESFWRLAQENYLAQTAQQEGRDAHIDPDTLDVLSGEACALKYVVMTAMQPHSYNELMGIVRHAQELYRQYPADDYWAAGYRTGLARAVQALDYKER